ncbi:MAG: hypothetical protein RMK29_18785 [Myxococcales bacterium]|nr:hypothetical protein [Myxococcales bacterium]
MHLWFVLLSLLCSVLSACRREAPAVVLDARPPPDLAPAAPAAPQHPPMCEVEIMGQVVLPRTVPKGTQATIVVAQGDCLAPDARVLGRARSAQDGRFFIEVFSDWGADLSVCAAVEPVEGQPVRVYGKAAGTFHAEAEGEVIFRDVRVELKPGPPHAFPKVRIGGP